MLTTITIFIFLFIPVIVVSRRIKLFRHFSFTWLTIALNKAFGLQLIIGSVLFVSSLIIKLVGGLRGTEHTFVHAYFWLAENYVGICLFAYLPILILLNIADWLLMKWRAMR